MHRLTEAGRESLAAWLASDLDRQPERQPFLALEAIQAATPSARTRGEQLRLATLDHGLRHVRTELAWLDSVEEQLP